MKIQCVWLWGRHGGISQIIIFFLWHEFKCSRTCVYFTECAERNHFRRTSKLPAQGSLSPIDYHNMCVQVPWLRIRLQEIALGENPCSGLFHSVLLRIRLFSSRLNDRLLLCTEEKIWGYWTWALYNYFSQCNVMKSNRNSCAPSVSFAWAPLACPSVMFSKHRLLCSSEHFCGFWSEVYLVHILVFFMTLYLSSSISYNHSCPIRDKMRSYQ